MLPRLPSQLLIFKKQKCRGKRESYPGVEMTCSLVLRPAAYGRQTCTSYVGDDTCPYLWRSIRSRTQCLCALQCTPIQCARSSALCEPPLLSLTGPFGTSLCWPPVCGSLEKGPCGPHKVSRLAPLHQSRRIELLSWLSY